MRGAVGIARRLAIPPLLIGLTVVGFGTSTPELLVSVDAALRGAPDIAIGNIVGSNIGNILLIVGLVAYLVWAYRQPGTDTSEAAATPPLPLWQSLIWVAVGLGALMLGARFLVDSAISIARGYGISEAFIGLTVVAIGTSLPELATSLIAALRRQSEIAIGNIVGSNIFNVLGILGVTALIAPIPVAERFLVLDLPAMILVSALLTGLLLLRPRIGRVTGVMLLLGYGAYLWMAQG